MEIPAAQVLPGERILGLGVVARVLRFHAEVADNKPDYRPERPPERGGALAIARAIASEVEASYTQTLDSIAVEGLGFRHSYRPDQRVAVIRTPMLA